MEWPICITDDKAEACLYKSFFVGVNYAEKSVFIERGWIDSNDVFPFAFGILWRWANIPAINNIYYRELRKNINHDLGYE